MMTSSNGNISALLALCEGNSPFTGEFPSQRPVTRSFDVLFDLHLNKWLSKQSTRWWFETPSRQLWRYCNGYITVFSLTNSINTPYLITRPIMLDIKRAFLIESHNYIITMPRWLLLCFVSAGSHENVQNWNRHYCQQHLICVNIEMFLVNAMLTEHNGFP